MFNFLKKIFRRKESIISAPEFDNVIKAKIRNLSFDDEKIVATNVDGVDIIYFYKDILAIYIIVDGNDYLPQPKWTIQSKGGGIDIYNDTKNTERLFFEILDTKLDGYTSDETQQEILKAMGCVNTGFFHIWERHDANEIFKSVE